jgi:26S proteasome regulatory subunit N6
LRQRIQCRLAVLLLEQKAFPEALSLVKTLSYEVKLFTNTLVIILMPLQVKKLDDKQTLVEVYLTESRIYHAIGNLPKSSAALTSSRTAANSIYVPPAQQAEIDMQVCFA